MLLLLSTIVDIEYFTPSLSTSQRYIIMEYSFVVTPEIRKLEFFSMFEDGCVVNTSLEIEQNNIANVTIARPFIREIVTDVFKPAEQTADNLILAIETMSYLMLPTIAAVEELVWILAAENKQIERLFVRNGKFLSIRVDLPMPL
jgi:hypothetical protein